MKSNTAINFAPIYTDEKKVDVSLTDNQAVITLSTWTEDIGWCRQKTMALDAAMLDDLHRVISSARYRLNKEKVSDSEDAKAANVISFPSFT